MKFKLKDGIFAFTGPGLLDGEIAPREVEGTQFLGELPFLPTKTNHLGRVFQEMGGTVKKKVPTGRYLFDMTGHSTIDEMQIIEIGYWYIPPFRAMIPPEELETMIEP